MQTEIIACPRHKRNSMIVWTSKTNLLLILCKSLIKANYVLINLGWWYDIGEQSSKNFNAEHLVKQMQVFCYMFLDSFQKGWCSLVLQDFLSNWSITLLLADEQLYFWWKGRCWLPTLRTWWPKICGRHTSKFSFSWYKQNL